MKQLIAISLVIALLFNSGCATIFTGTKDQIRFNSEPPNATVAIDGMEVGKTPCTVTVNRSLGTKSVTITKENYRDKNLVLQKQFNAIAILDIFTLLGLIVDLATGSVTEYSPLMYTVTLEPVSAYERHNNYQQPETVKTPILNNSNTSANFKIGDHVSWQHEGQWYTGTVNAGIDSTYCLVKFDNDGSLTKLSYQELTKSQSNTVIDFKIGDHVTWQHEEQWYTGTN